MSGEDATVGQELVDLLLTLIDEEELLLTIVDPEALRDAEAEGQS